MATRGIEKLADELLESVRGFVARKLEPLEQRNADLERRLTALERRLESEKRRFFYRGVFVEGETYQEHDFATLGGALWCCLVDGTSDRPGTSDRWQLAVKSGDRRDRRR